MTDATSSRKLYLSVEELWRLSHAARPIEEAFGGRTIWLVGSVLFRSNWRDVDLRIILDESEYDRLFNSVVNDVNGIAVGLLDQFRMLIQTSISGLLRQATGLPIDFQVQSQAEANQHDARRQPLCLRPYINPDFVPQWHSPPVRLCEHPDGCSERHHANGLCRWHYDAARRAVQEGDA